VAVWLRRNTELLVTLGLFGAGLTLLGQGVFGGYPMLIFLGGSLALISLPLIRRAALRMRLSRGDAAGVVLIDERRVGFFGPDAGGFLETDHLFGVDLAVAEGGPEWILIGEEADSLRIPVSAKDAEALLDVFSALPGFRVDLAVAHLEDQEHGRHRIWRRPASRLDGFPPVPGTSYRCD
jgi:hypothetical protein